MGAAGALSQSSLMASLGRRTFARRHNGTVLYGPKLETLASRAPTIPAKSVCVSPFLNLTRVGESI